jgi:hypothetical protein
MPHEIGGYHYGGGFRDVLLFFAYTRLVPYRSFVVSFTDAEGIEHSVRFSAASLYEAAVLALAEFRRHSFAETIFGTPRSSR